jgi:hypothetical protein
MNSYPSFYTTPGPMTDPGEYASLLDGLPNALPELVRALQELAVHIFWAGRYGLELSEERRKEVGLRPLRRKLARIRELDTAPLNQPRPAGLRLVSNCRDFSTMITGMLIHQGVPARARCGFGVYFIPNNYEDHWVAEYWNADEARWVMFDPQLDEMMCETLKLTFDPLDMPAGQFVTGGQAWLLCRRAGCDPDQFGISGMHGWDFILGNLFRDLLALNKVEILPWDYWPGMAPSTAGFSAADWEDRDHLAELTAATEAHFAELQALYEGTPALKVPGDWLN